jgi:hypothetical protein
VFRGGNERHRVSQLSHLQALACCVRVFAALCLKVEHDIIIDWQHICDSRAVSRLWMTV